MSTLGADLLTSTVLVAADLIECVSLTAEASVLTIIWGDGDSARDGLPVRNGEGQALALSGYAKNSHSDPMRNAGIAMT